MESHNAPKTKISHMSRLRLYGTRVLRGEAVGAPCAVVSDAPWQAGIAVAGETRLLACTLEALWSPTNEGHPTHGSGPDTRTRTLPTCRESPMSTHRTRETVYYTVLCVSALTRLASPTRLSRLPRDCRPCARVALRRLSCDPLVEAATPTPRAGFYMSARPSPAGRLPVAGPRLAVAARRCPCRRSESA